MKKLTKVFLISVLALIIVWDVIALILGGATATVSYVIFMAAGKFAFIPYAMGVLVSHFFAPDLVIKYIPKLRYIIWITLSAIVLTLSIIFYPITLHPFASMSIGRLVGFFWCQKEIK